jgi:DNA invertase Pin-like site-specific DNA recombinase
MPTYVIYARKSTESEDRQVMSIDSQVHELRAIAARNGATVSDVLTEAHSAKAPGRPVFSELMRRVHKGEVSGILCWKMDRLARNPYDAGVVLQAQLDGKIERIITSDGVKNSDGNDRLLGSFEFALATKYIDDLRANVKRGNRARFQRGWINYIPPPGYVNDRIAKTIVKDPERFKLVRQMWTLLLTGSVRPSQILKTANETWHFRTRKYRSRGGTPLSASVMYAMFANPFYAGTIRLRNGDTYTGAHEPMVTREEFARGQELLGRPGRPRPIRHRFPFTGLIRCANCGGTATAEEHVKRSGKRYVYYRCSHNRTGRPCREPAVPAQTLLDQLASELLTLRITEKAQHWIETRLHKAISSEAGQVQATRESQERALQDVRREEDNLLSLRLRDQIDDATFAARRDEAKRRREIVEVSLTRATKSADELLQRLRDVLAFSARAHEVFTTGSPVQQRQILETVGLNYTLGARKASYTLKNPFRMISGARTISDWCARAEDLRTWLGESDDFTLPDLDDAPYSTIVPDLPWVA